VASVEQTAMEEVQEEVQIEDVADIEQVIEEAQEALETAEASLEADAATESDEPVADEEAVEEDAIEELVSEQGLEDLGSDDERLSPDELAALAAQGSEDDKADDKTEALEEFTAQDPEADNAFDETESSETLASLELDGSGSAVEGQDASSGTLEQEASNQLATALEESGQGMQSAFFGEAEQVSQASAFESNAQSSQSFGSFQMRVDFGSSTSAAGSSGGSFGTGSSPLDAAISAVSPMSMSTTFEILNSGGGQSSAAPVAASASSEKSENEMAEGQSETIEEMGSVPAFNAYRQATLSDRADFYAVRDIYRNRRLRDADFEMYRMTQTNDARWREIVDAQYR
jgi:hypothetical protein